MEVFIEGLASGSKVLGTDGDDILEVNSFLSGTAGITLTGRGGDDVLFATVGKDKIFGGAGDDLMTGFGGNDTIFCGAGNDMFRYSFDAQCWTGGAGADQFEFGLFSFPPAGRTTIVDYNRTEDIFVMIDFNFTYNFGNQSNILQKGVTVVNGTTAAGIAQFLYDTDSGVLSIDRNGLTTGGVFELAILTNKANLTASDFELV